MSDADPELRLDASVQRLAGPDGTATLLGGSPLRVLRLRTPADAVIEALSRGCTVEQALEGVSIDRRAASRRFVDTLIRRGLVHPTPKADLARALADVTIVIPVRNRAVSLARLLHALAPLGERGVRMVVVDDGSTDQSAFIAEQAGATVIRHSRARGPAAARNAGAEIVATELLAFLDSDVVPREHWLDRCVAHLDLAGSMRVDLVAPRIVGLVPDEDASLIERYENIRSPLDLGPESSLIAPLTKVAYVPAAAFVVRTDTFRAVNGFDAALHVGEDVDLLWRLHRKNAVLRYEPRAEVAHDHRSQFGPMLRRRMQYGTSAAALDSRHRGFVPPAVLSPWSIAVWALTLAHPLGAVGGACVALATAERLTARLPQLSTSDARRLALRGHLAAGEQLADASVRTWLPVFLFGSLGMRRFRLVLFVGIVGQGWREHRRTRRIVALPMFLALRACDNAAYGVGVWVGSLRTRTIGALTPKIVNWPGRTKTDEDAMP